MSQALSVGKSLPEFQLQDSYGETVTKEDLLGGPFVLYFYPKDNTPGCTQEACEFRDVMDSFEDMNILVLGVSPDSIESHQKFIEEHNLSFTLLSDPQFQLAKGLGVVKEDGKPSIVRSTFIFDEDGVIQWVESPVSIPGHIQRVITAIQDVLG